MYTLLRLPLFVFPYSMCNFKKVPKKVQFVFYFSIELLRKAVVELYIHDLLLHSRAYYVRYVTEFFDLFEDVHYFNSENSPNIIVPLHVILPVLPTLSKGNFSRRLSSDLEVSWGQSDNILISTISYPPYTWTFIRRIIWR